MCWNQYIILHFKTNCVTCIPGFDFILNEVRIFTNVQWIYSWWTDSIYHLLTHIHVVRIAICKSLFHILDSQTRFYVICGKEKEFFNKSKDWERVWTFLSQMISIKIKHKSRLNAECVHNVFHFLFNIFGLFVRRMFVPGFFV